MKPDQDLSDRGSSPNPMQGEMAVIQQQIKVLRQQAEDARLKTLASIKEGIQNTTLEGLHQTLFPNTQIPSTMANQDSNQQTQKNSNIDSGQGAMSYTDAHMTDMLQKINGTVNNAMQQAMKATQGAGQAAATTQASAQADDSKTTAQPTTSQEAPATVQSEMEKAAQSVEQGMAQAQQAVSNAISQPKETTDKAQQTEAGQTNAS